MKFARVVSGLSSLKMALVSALAVASLAAPEAHAFQTLRLKSNADRVGVVVLAYNDNWTSYAGEWLYDKYLRLSLGKRYSTLYISRGTKKGLSAEDIQAAFRTAMESGHAIDFMTSTHSDGSTIKLKDGLSVRPEDLLSPVIAEDSSSQDRLEFAANFGCESEGQSDQFERLGFRSYVGHSGISSGAVAMREFLSFWVRKCGTLRQATDDTNAWLSRLFAPGSVALWIYKKLSGESEYSAVLLSFGQDQTFCDE